MSLLSYLNVNQGKFKGAVIECVGLVAQDIFKYAREGLKRTLKMNLALCILEGHIE